MKERAQRRAQMPKDRRKLARWAVQGTHSDYEKLRASAQTLQRPSYVTSEAADVLANATRPSMVTAAHGGDHEVLDAIAWLLDVVPGRGWLKTLGQAALKPFRGDALHEVDEQYARLVSAAYQEERPSNVGEWQRVSEFDSNYITVFDNPDGHRFVAVRGTKFNAQDLAEDALIGVAGRPTNRVGAELKRVLDNTEPGRVCDVGGHSLGTSLILTAYEGDDSMQDRVHETYLYNPAMSPLSPGNVTQKYEGDERVRYFIDLMDPVSLGGLGERGPKNVVYRTAHGDPLSSHALVQWGGANWEHDEEQPAAQEPQPVAQEPQPAAQEPQPAADEPGFELDFGNSFDAGAWNVYWN